MKLNIKRLVLDVLKPLEPDLIEFSSALARSMPGSQLNIRVQELDKATETLVITITGKNLDMESIRNELSALGASLHSIDEVEIDSSTTK